MGYVLSGCNTIIRLMNRINNNNKKYCACSVVNTPIMDKSASCKIFEEYVDSLFPIGGKRSRSAVMAGLCQGES